MSRMQYRQAREEAIARGEDPDVAEALILSGGDPSAAAASPAPEPIPQPVTTGLEGGNGGGMGHGGLGLSGMVSWC